MNKLLFNNKIVFKSPYKEFITKNDNIAYRIINNIKSNKNILVDESSNRVNSNNVINNIKKVARGLDKLGIKKNDIVGVMLPNVIEFIYVVLGSLLSGATISTINPIFTIDEIINTLSTINPKYIFIDLSNYNRIKSYLIQLFPSCECLIVINDIYNKPIINLESHIGYNNTSLKIIQFNQLINNEGIFNCNYPISNEDDIAIILFSSGTTGRSKGVCLSHGNINSNIDQMYSSFFNLYPQNINDSILVCIPLYHAFGLNVILFSFLNFGGCLIISRNYNFKTLLTSIQIEKPTSIVLVPPIALQLIHSPIVNKYDCSSLKSFLISGAPLSLETLDNLKKRFQSKNQSYINNINIIALYGLTEASPVTVVSKDNEKINQSVGYLTANMQAKVINLENGSNLDSNQIGEICLKGPNIMKGYYNNINATNDAFDSEGYLLTGDIGYFNDNGEMFIIERKKDIIKCFGYQVSPTELETILLSHPKIQEACVIGVPSTESGECPRAFIQLKPNENLSSSEVHKWINPKVSYYKYITGGIYFIKEIPKSQSGKILKNTLKQYGNSKL